MNTWANKSKETLKHYFGLAINDLSADSYREIEGIIDDILAAAKPDTEVKSQAHGGGVPIGCLHRPDRQECDLCRDKGSADHPWTEAGFVPNTSLVDELAREIQILREQRDRLVESASNLCGHFGRMAFNVGISGRPPHPVDWIRGDKHIEGTREIIKEIKGQPCTPQS